MSILDKLPEWLKLLICREETTKEAVDRINSENPPPPCGYEQHWWWEDELGFHCPVCEATRKRQQQIERENKRDERLAEMIADKIAEKLRAHKGAI